MGVTSRRYVDIQAIKTKITAAQILHTKTYHARHGERSFVGLPLIQPFFLAGFVQSVLIRPALREVGDGVDGHCESV